MAAGTFLYNALHYIDRSSNNPMNKHDEKNDSFAALDKLIGKINSQL